MKNFSFYFKVNLVLAIVTCMLEFFFFPFFFISLFFLCISIIYLFLYIRLAYKLELKNIEFKQDFFAIKKERSDLLKILDYSSKKNEPFSIDIYEIVKQDLLQLNQLYNEDKSIETLQTFTLPYIYINNEKELLSLESHEILYRIYHTYVAIKTRT